MRRFLTIFIAGLIAIAFGPAVVFAQEGRDYEKALEAYEKNDLNTAERYFKRELSSNPDNGYAWFGLGCVYLDRYNDNSDSDSAISFVENAAECYDKALELVPRDDAETIYDLYADRIEMATLLNDFDKLLDVVDHFVLFSKYNEDAEIISFALLTRASIYQAASVYGYVDIDKAIPFIVSDLSESLIFDESHEDFDSYLDLFVDEEPSYEMSRSYSAIREMLLDRLDESDELEDMLNRCVTSLEKKWSTFKDAVERKPSNTSVESSNKQTESKSSSSQKSVSSSSSSESAVSRARTARIKFKMVYGMRQVDCSIDSRNQTACYRPDVYGIRVTVMMANNLLSTTGAASSSIKVGDVVTLKNCVIGGMPLGNVKATVVENLHPAIEFGPNVFGKGAKVSIDDSSLVLILTK